jgi:hypothetical protein
MISCIAQSMHVQLRGAAGSDREVAAMLHAGRVSAHCELREPLVSPRGVSPLSRHTKGGGYACRRVLWSALGRSRDPLMTARAVVAWALGARSIHTVPRNEPRPRRAGFLAGPQAYARRSRSAPNPGRESCHDPVWRHRSDTTPGRHAGQRAGHNRRMRQPSAHDHLSSSLFPPPPNVPPYLRDWHIIPQHPRSRPPQALPRPPP